MADSKISDLTALSSPANDDVFAIVDTDAGQTKKITFANINSAVSAAVSADDIGTGDAAVTIATSSGNITIDAQAGDTDIIFKGTDSSSDITALTLDMSEAGAAAFNSTVTATGFVIGSADINESDLEQIDGLTAGTVAASKAVVVDSNKDISSFRNVTATTFIGNIDAVDGDFDGTLEADAITVGGTALGTVIAGTTVTNSTNAAHVSVADNENTNEENLIPFIEDASATGNVGLESDGDFAYNPSTGTVTATIFKGNVDAVDGDFDGTLEADAITVDGTALNEYIADTVGAMVTSNTESGITVAYEDGDNTLDFTIGTLNQDTTGTAANATHVTVADNENTDENNLITFIEDASATGNVGLESDGDFHYNPSSGTVTATVFKGNVDAVDGDFDGTLEADAITVDGTALNEYIADTVGAMVGSNTETGLAVTYDDSDNTLDFVIGSQVIVNSMLADDAVGADELAANAVVNASVASSAAIAFSKMEDLTASRALVSDGSGDVSAATTTSTEIGYVNGVTSAIQTQLDAKATAGLAVAMAIAL